MLSAKATVFVAAIGGVVGLAVGGPAGAGVGAVLALACCSGNTETPAQRRQRENAGRANTYYRLYGAGKPRR